MANQIQDMGFLVRRAVSKHIKLRCATRKYNFSERTQEVSYSYSYQSSCRASLVRRTQFLLSRHRASSCTLHRQASYHRLMHDLLTVALSCVDLGPDERAKKPRRHAWEGDCWSSSKTASGPTALGGAMRVLGCE